MYPPSPVVSVCTGAPAGVNSITCPLATETITSPAGMGDAAKARLSPCISGEDIATSSANTTAPRTTIAPIRAFPACLLICFPGEPAGHSGRSQRLRPLRKRYSRYHRSYCSEATRGRIGRRFWAISNGCAKPKSNSSLKEKNDFRYQILAEGTFRRFASR